jgi:hypothetical protein
MKYEYFEVIKRVKNLPFKAGSFIKGYTLANKYCLGGYAVGEYRKKELVKSGAIKRIAKTELTRILIGRNVF